MVRATGVRRVVRRRQRGRTGIAGSGVVVAICRLLRMRGGHVDGSRRSGGCRILRLVLLWWTRLLRRLADTGSRRLVVPGVWQHRLVVAGIRR